MREDQRWEQEWWGPCVNSFGEEAKQLCYAPRMGLVNLPRDGRWPVYDLAGRSVLDIGGGPSSMLLKCVDGGELVVCDPCPYPIWTAARYRAAGVTVAQVPAERLDWPRHDFHEAWIYNCLQHVESPARVVANALEHLAPGGILRVFEWIDTPVAPGHPHTLTAADLDMWIHEGVLMPGKVEEVNESGAVGRCYHGFWTFP